MDDPVGAGWLDRRPRRSGRRSARVPVRELGADALGVDLAGAYAVQLIVRDNYGVRSQPCVVEFEAIPQGAMRGAAHLGSPDLRR